MKVFRKDMRKEMILSLKKQVGWIRWVEVGRPLETEGAASAKEWRYESADADLRWAEMKPGAAGRVTG